MARARKPTTRAARWAAATLLCAALCATGAHPVVRARPVTIGVYQELPFGVTRGHPSVTEGVRATRDGRILVRLPAREPSLLFTVEVGAGGVASPVALSSNVVLAVAADAGAHVARSGVLESRGVTLRGATGVSLAPGGGYVVTEADGLVFVDAQLGGLTRVPLAGLAPHAALVLEDGSAVVSAGSRVVRVDAGGREHFSVSVASRVQSPIARTPAGQLVAATTSEVVFVAESGQVQRREALHDQPVAGPAVALDGTVWMLTRSELVAFEASSGVRLRVPAPATGPVTHGALAIAVDGSVRVSVLGFGVLALNASGAELWRAPLELARFIVVDAGGVSLALTQDGVLVALDSAGSELWRTRVAGGGPHSAPVVAADGTLYVGLRGGSLAALR